jgi:RNA polymerase sigma factor (TIGR02999 family)
MASVSPGPGSTANSITDLLGQLSAGNREVEAQLIPQVYDELHRLAGYYMRRERGAITLQPTALVHEAYAALVQPRQVPWKSRTHFFATAARLMRNILVDHARARQAAKRGGMWQQVTLEDALLPAKNRTLDVLVLHEALERLAQFDARQAQVVELHFFGGLTFAEIGLILNIAERTAKSDWSMARDWLKGELSKKP